MREERNKSDLKYFRFGKRVRKGSFHDGLVSEINGKLYTKAALSNF